MNFDFSGRYTNAFGYVATNVSSKLAEAGFQTALERNDNKYQQSVFVKDKNISFDEVLLYNDSAEYLFAYRVLAEEYNQVFATPPMFSLTRSKKLVTTLLNDSDIEVTERYSTEPWQITWKGLLIDMENHQFPIDRMEAINDIFEVNSVWKVSSEILAALKINSIIILDVSIEFVEGYEDTIAYTFTTRATKSAEYQLINEN